ncbi:MAG: hypothetical protein VYE77_04935 [Planctomycetota bacterium]|nr:hypothetical protein [Planctomycetota bacterium]
MSVRLFSAAALVSLLVVACSDSGEPLQIGAAAPKAVNDPENVATRATQQPSGGFSARPAGGAVARKPDASQDAAADVDKVAEKAPDEVAAADAAPVKSGLRLTYFTIPG